MSASGSLGFLNVNRSLMRETAAPRHLRLPKASPFPKLDINTVKRHAAPVKENTTGARLVGVVGTSVVGGAIPEISSGLSGLTSRCAVENVRRESTAPRWGSRSVWAQFFGRMLSGRQGR